MLNSPSMLQVRTILDQGTRSTFDSILGSSCSSLPGGEIGGAGSASVAPSVDGECGASLAAIYRNYPYGAHAVLIIQWAYLIGSCQARCRDATIERCLDVLGGWDAALLVVCDRERALLRTVCESRLAPRLGTVRLPLNAEETMLQLRRVIAVSAQLAPPHAKLSKLQMWQLLSLPQQWQWAVCSMMREPFRWNVDRLCKSLAADRRTIERAFRKVGLPAPGRVIRNASLRCSTLE